MYRGDRYHDTHCDPVVPGVLDARRGALRADGRARRTARARRRLPAARTSSWPRSARSTRRRGGAAHAMAPADRAAYEAEQAALLRALIRGDGFPDGFDAVKAAAASHSLWRKRMRAVAAAWPALALDLGDGFDAAFEAVRPRDTGAGRPAARWRRAAVRPHAAAHGELSEHAPRRAAARACGRRRARRRAAPAPRGVRRRAVAARSAADPGRAARAGRRAPAGGPGTFLADSERARSGRLRDPARSRPPARAARARANSAMPAAKSSRAAKPSRSRGARGSAKTWRTSPSR